MSRLPSTLRGRGAVVWAAGALVLLYLLVLGLSYLDPGFGGPDVARNVELADQPVDGQDDEALAATVARLGDARRAAVVELDTGSGSVTTDARTLGLEVDVDATVDAVHGDTGTVFLRPFRWIGSFVTGRSVGLAHRVDESVLRSAISEVDLPGVTAATEPSLAGDATGVQVVAGVSGTGVDADGLAAALVAAADDTAEGPIVVDTPLAEIAPLVSDAEAEAVAADAAAATAGPFTVVVGEVETVLDVATVRSWLVLAAEEPGAADWELDESIAAPGLAELFVDAGDPGTDASFLVEGGVVQIVGGENPTTCCDEGSVDRLEQALRRGASRVVLDLIPAESSRNREWAEGLGIVEEVSSFTTTHACCQNRVTNIHLIADATRGVVIEPGQVFSLNEHVGQRTADKGYVAAGGITNGVLVDQLGGGISQYTTGLFNAAFYAGLDFDDYQAHSIYFSRYPYGREATLSWPAPDLKIRNTTPYGILIWPTYTDTSITVAMYSTRHVTAEQTGQTTSPQGTCTRVRTERTRTYLDGRVEVDTVGALYRRREGENCSGESSVPTTTTTPAPTEPTTEPTTDPAATDPPATDPPATDPPATDPAATDPPASP